jgi:hypothetical protein
MKQPLIAFNIVELWNTDEWDIAHYLCVLDLKFTMRGITLHQGQTYTIYTAEMTSMDAFQIKLVFPGISIFTCKEPEKVSTFARNTYKDVVV